MQDIEVATGGTNHFGFKQGLRQGAISTLPRTATTGAISSSLSRTPGCPSRPHE